MESTTCSSTASISSAAPGARSTIYKRYSARLCKLLGFQRESGLHRDPGAGLGRGVGHRLDASATLKRLDYDDYRIFVGHYRNDPATAAAIASVADPRVEPVQVEADGPTTKADCLNHLYDALIATRSQTGASAKAIVLHDAEDVVHPLELRIFDGLIDRAAVIQLPVLPLIDPHSRWVSGHYCDEFAEAHIKELVVREAVGAAIPLAGVGCAIARKPLAQLAAMQDGKPFAGRSMTEDYEVGLRLGALGLKTMFVRIPAQPGEPGVVASRGHFPATLGEAVRQKARWLGGIALSGWDRLGWSGGLGERWMRMRDRRGPLAALLLLAAYAAALLWSQLWLAEALGAPVQARMDPTLTMLLTINFWLLAWRVLMRAVLHRIGLRLAAKVAVDSAAGRRQRHRHARRGPRGLAASRRRRAAVGQDPAHLPGGAGAMRPSLRFLALAVVGWAGIRAATLGVLPGAEMFTIDRSEAKARRRRSSRRNSRRSNRSRRMTRPTRRRRLRPARCARLSGFHSSDHGAGLLCLGAGGRPRRHRRRGVAGILPQPAPQFYSPIPALDEWPLSRIASSSVQQRRST